MSEPMLTSANDFGKPKARFSWAIYESQEHLAVAESNPAHGERVSSLNQKALALAKPVYTALAAHQRGEEGWSLCDMARVLDTWWNHINEGFELHLPRSPLRLERKTRRNCLGYFNPRHNEFGLQMEIALGVAQHTDEQGLDWGDLIGTLTHEALHLWQHLFGSRGPSPHNHHNKEFRDKAQSLGLIVDYRGHQTYEPKSAFIDLLAQFDVSPPRRLVCAGEMPPLTKPPHVASKSKLKKWSCACPQNAWVGAGKFVAICPQCNCQFSRVS